MSEAADELLRGARGAENRLAIAHHVVYDVAGATSTRDPGTGGYSQTTARRTCRSGPDGQIAGRAVARGVAVRHKGGQSLVNPSCSICRTWPSVTPNRSATSLIDRGTVIPWSWAPTSASKICLRWSSKSRFSK